jgi:hypothetical protein
MIRGCKVPGVQLQIVREDSGDRSGLIEVAHEIHSLEGEEREES